MNLHGGGNGFYTPIAGGVTTGFVRRPEYFGMELAKEFVGATLLQSTLACDSDKVRSYAGRKAGVLLVLAINKTEQAVAIKTPIHRAGRQWLLAGPAIDAKQGVTLAKSQAGALHNGVLHIEPYSAVLIEG